MRGSDGYCASSSRHHGGEKDHECSDTSLCDRNQQKRDDCAADYTESDGKGTNTDAKWVIAYIYVNGQSWPMERQADLPYIL